MIKNNFVFSQNYCITGIVIDIKTGEPIPFANVYLEHTSIGASTNIDGKFEIKTSILSDSIKVQVIGFYSKSYKILKERKQKIDFALTPLIYSLLETEIKSGENPSIRIVKEAIKRKNNYNPDKLKAYQHQSYVKTDIAINKISEKAKNGLLLNSLSKTLDSMQKYSGNNKSFELPVFLSEQLSEYYYNKNPKLSKEVVKSVSLKGILLDDSELLSQFMGVAFMNFNFYDNTIDKIGKSLISPLSDVALLFYDYYILDTVLIGNSVCFELKIKPKNPKDLTFKGKIWISDSTFALKKIQVEFGKEANINWINRYVIEQVFEPITDSVWMPVRIHLIIDLSIAKKGIGIIGLYDYNNFDFVINKPKRLSFFNNNVELLPDAMDVKFSDFDSLRQRYLQDTIISSQRNKYLDTIKENKLIKFNRILLNLLMDGYYPVSGLDIGSWSSLIGFNYLEGWRPQISLRTNDVFSKRIMFSGYVGYGFNDSRYKYGMQADVFISRRYWTKLCFSYKTDLERFGFPDPLFDEPGFFDPISQFINSLTSWDKLSFTKSARIWFETDLLNRFHQIVAFTYKDFNPQNFENNFNFAYIDKNGKLKNYYKSTELTLQTRYSKKATYSYKGNRRAFVGSYGTNVFTFNYTLGIKGFLNSNFSYHKFSFRVERNLKMGVFGVLYYSLYGIKILGNVPYTLAYIPNGNESYLFYREKFNKMDYFEFVATEALEVILFHQFEGFFFNRIPLLKKLKLREVVGASLVYGNLSKNSTAILPLGSEGTIENFYLSSKPLSYKKPYLEINYGIDNIFRIIRVQVVHRLTYKEKNANPIGIRVSVHISF